MIRSRRRRRGGHPAEGGTGFSGRPSAVRVIRSLCCLTVFMLASCTDESEEPVTGEPCEARSGKASEVGLRSNQAAERAPIPVVRWEERAPIPTPRIAYAAAALEGRIHVVGGISAAGHLHEAYDPERDTWVRLPDLPVRVDHGWAASVDGRMYVGDGGSTQVFCYDPGSRAWVQVADSPQRHGNTPAVAVIDGRIYLAGGVQEGWNPGWDVGDATGGQELSVYDPSMDTWTELTPMSCGRHHTVGAAIDGRMHVVGGRPGAQVCHEVYDPTRNAWERRADLPTGREGMAGGVVGGWLVVVGGEGNPDDPHFLFDAVEAYNPETDEWVELPPMPNPRHGTFAATIADTMFLPGGGRMLGRVEANDVLIFER